MVFRKLLEFLLFECQCLVLSRTDFFFKATLQQPGHYKKAQDGKGRQCHTEQTEGIEILLVPETVGEKN